jgi:hypothetical protein
MANGTGYIDLPIPASRETMIQTALYNIATAMPGWRPREGNLEVLLLEQFADMAAEAASVAAQVPLSIFSYYGSLIGVNQNTGTPMQINTQWTLTSQSATDTLFPAGTTATAVINGTYYQFSLDGDLTITAGNTVSTGTMTASFAGSSYNSVYGTATYLEPNYFYATLANIQIIPISSSVPYVPGVDQETTQHYLNRLSDQLTLYTPRPIIAPDYAYMASNINGVGRAAAIDNLDSYVNLLPVSQAVPALKTSTVPGWSGLNGTTVTASTVTPGIKATTSGSALSNFSTLSTVSTITAKDSFVPLSSTTTTATVASSATSISLTNSSTTFPNSAGFGWIAVSTTVLVGFSYTGSSSTALSGVVFNSTASFPSSGIASGARIAYAGPSAFWTGQLDAFGNAFTASPCTLTPVSVCGLTWKISNGTSNDVIVISNALTKVSGSSVTDIGYSTSVVGNTYTTGTALTFTLYAGITTGPISLSSNGTNLTAMALVGAASGTTSIKPLIVATAIYKNETTPYVFYIDPDSIIGTYTYSTNAQMLTAYIAAKSPQTASSSGVSIADPLISSSYYPNAATVTINIYWANAGTSVDNYVEYAALYQTNHNIAFFENDAWYTDYNETNGSPGSILADGLFNSVISGSITSTITNTGAISGVTTLNLNSISGWPPAGAGSFVDASSTTHYFSYTGTSGNSLTGVAITPTTGNFATTQSTTCITPANTPNMWKQSGAYTYGTPYYLQNVGIQYAPSTTTLGGNVTFTSCIFNLPKSTQYVLDLTIDATCVSGANLPTVKICDATTNTAIMTATAIAGSSNRIQATYTSSSSYEDVYALITLPSGMTTYAGGSVVIKNMQLIPVTGALASTSAAAIDALGNPGTNPGTYWTQGGQYGTQSPRAVTVFVSDRYGMQLSKTNRQAIQNYLQSYREMNFKVDVVSPSYLVIDVAYSVLSAVGYDQSTVQQSILDQLSNYLSPQYWGSVNKVYSTWDTNKNVIRYLDVAGLIDSAPGVAGLVALTICIHGSTPGTSDIAFSSQQTLLGTLPILGAVSATITPSNLSSIDSYL